MKFTDFPRLIVVASRSQVGGVHAGAGRPRHLSPAPALSRKRRPVAGEFYLSHNLDDAASDERLVTIEELMALNPGIEKGAARVFWRRRGRHRAAATDQQRSLAIRT